MKKNTQAYIEKNEKQYKYYISGMDRLGKGAVSLVWILFMVGQILLIRKLLIKIKAIRDAGTGDVGNMEVMDWVSQQVEIQRFGGGFFIILSIFFLMAVMVLVIYKRVKSYDLYKKGWLKWILAILNISLFVLLIFESGGMDVWLFISIIFEAASLATNFNVFLPAEIREDYSRIINFVSFVGNLIVRKS